MKFQIESLKGFTIIPNEYLKDKHLSLKAKGFKSPKPYIGFLHTVNTVHILNNKELNK